MIKSFIALDLETTGLSAKEEKIIEVGAVKVVDGVEISRYQTLINPGKIISNRIIEVTGIDNEMVKDAPYIEDVISDILEYMEELPLLGHNLIFDYSFMKRAAINNKLEFEKMGIDTLKLARKYLTHLPSKKLDFLCEVLNIEDEQHHRAINDAVAAYKLYYLLCEKYGASECECMSLNYKVKRECPITPRQITFLSSLNQKHNLVVDYDITRLTKNEASRKIDIILSTYGR